MIRKVCFFGPKKMHFIQIESVLQTKNRSEPAKNRFPVALPDIDWLFLNGQKVCKLHIQKYNL